MKRMWLVFVSFGLLLALSVSTSVYFYRQYTVTRSQLSSEKSDDVARLVALVSRHIVIPEGETPKLLTVTNKEKLSGQAFFANADDGDTVLVFEKAKKAFLYDADSDRIIEVGPVTFNATVEPTPDMTPVRVYLYNGTNIAGLTREYDIPLKSMFPNVVIVDRGSAARRDYATSSIVDLTGTKASLAAAMAKALNLTVRSLPEGETASNAAEFLIILGADTQ